MRTTTRALRRRGGFLLASVALSVLLPAAVMAATLSGGPSATIPTTSISAASERDAWFASPATSVIGDFASWWQTWRNEAAARAAAQRATALARPMPATTSVATKPATTATTARTTTAAPRPQPAYVGRNRMWIPSLGMNRSVTTFACTRSTPPSNLVYRWGCAGRNNIYLFGHAWGVMKPLHDAYYSHRLKVGMKVVYADGAGHVRTYKVTTWRVVSPADTAWAIASQSRPSMSLQTCVGAQSQYRLVVRLVAI